MAAGLAPQGRVLGATALVTGPPGCSSSVTMWQRLKGWSPLSSGKYLIKFFSLFFFSSPLLHVAPDRIWVWGLQAQKDPKEEEECEGVGLATEGLRETLSLTNGAPLPSWRCGHASWWPLTATQSHSICNKESLLQVGCYAHPHAYLLLTGTGKKNFSEQSSVSG